MIVCSCNVLTDHDIRIVVTASREQPLSALQVYGCLGCSIRCGRCARAIKRIMTEASIACAEGCACCSAVGSAV
jgi:bacterioferritin-associated ferredoxin